MSRETISPPFPPAPEEQRHFPAIEQFTPEFPAVHPSVAREAELRRLFDPPFSDHKGRPVNYGNYEYAKESGLIDEFAYDPDQNFDGLMHILVGDIKIKNGKRVSGGFHVNHDPEYISTVYGSSEITPDLESMTSKHRRQYVERPFEPRKTHVKVAGYEKVEDTVDKNGKPHVAVVGSVMFPREYDPLAALQAIRIAKNTRDKSQDEHKGDRIVAKGKAPLIDGETLMDVNLVLTPDEKIITAFPRIKESGYMKLTDFAIDKALGLQEDDTQNHE